MCPSFFPAPGKAGVLIFTQPSGGGGWQDALQEGFRVEWGSQLLQNQGPGESPQPHVEPLPGTPPPLSAFAEKGKLRGSRLGQGLSLCISLEAKVQTILLLGIYPPLAFPLVSLLKESYFSIFFYLNEKTGKTPNIHQLGGLAIYILVHLSSREPHTH